MKRPVTKKTPTHVTLREIEKCKPCCSTYAQVLQALNSNPSPAFSDNYTDGRFQNFQNPKFGPTDPIPLRLLRKLAVLKYQQERWAQWLCCKHPKLRHIAKARDAEVRKVQAKIGAVSKQLNTLWEERDRLESRPWLPEIAGPAPKTRSRR